MCWPTAPGAKTRNVPWLPPPAEAAMETVAGVARPNSPPGRLLLKLGRPRKRPGAPMVGAHPAARARRARHRRDLHLCTQSPKATPSRRRRSAIHWRSNLASKCTLSNSGPGTFQLTELETGVQGNSRRPASIRPDHHQLDTRIEAHIFVAFLADRLQVTLTARLPPLAPGLTPRSALEKLAAIQMVDVHLPIIHGRTLISKSSHRAGARPATAARSPASGTARATATRIDRRAPGPQHTNRL